MSKLNTAPVAYTYDDFFLAPVHSEIRSRKDPDVSTKLGTWNLAAPVVAAPMNTISEVDMAVTMAKLGGVAVIHRYVTLDNQIKMASEIFSKLTDADVKNPACKFMFAVGANGDAKERVGELWKQGVRGFCIDVANGHSVHCIETVEYIRQHYPEAHIMAGNVCTYDGAFRLAKAGASSIRVGVGPGSMCITRMVTGHGVPQLTALEECVKIKTSQYFGDIDCDENDDIIYKRTEYFDNISIIADGGIRYSGDVVKALAIGADAVMLGGMLAGTSDTPGKTHSVDGQLYKYYHGMASEAGRENWFGREQTSYVPEGESTRVAYKGDTGKVVSGIVSGLKVGMSYAGAKDLETLRDNAVWYKVTGAGHKEGTPHGK